MTFDNMDLIEEFYKKYKADAKSVNGSWQNYFQTFQQDLPKTESASSLPAERLIRLIEFYRRYGHLMAKINPLLIQSTQNFSLAQSKATELGLTNPAEEFPSYGLLPQEKAPLEEIIRRLKEIYCHTVGYEYSDLPNNELVKWIQQRIEKVNFTHLTLDQKKSILKKLTKAEILESFLHKKYIGQKRFSLEGAETLIPILDVIIEKGFDLGLQEIVLGMSHRGRLNVLGHILNKPYKDIFSEYEAWHVPEKEEIGGDVQYHKGYFSEKMTETGHKLKVTLANNPSHLESVDAVVEGEARAKQRLVKDEVKREKVVPILIHGDAAISGQGMIYETMQLWNLPGYTTGGTVHIVVNNQIGFTTLPKDYRSTSYCTDIARTFGCPVFHVNAEDPESCVAIASLAMEIRHEFHCDVLIDLYCYRKYGHNETDEPAFTQPIEYKIIRDKKNIRDLYQDQLNREGVLDKNEEEMIAEEFKKELEKAFSESKNPPKIREILLGPLPENTDLFKEVKTGVSLDILRGVAEIFSTIPPDFHLHPKVENGVKERLAMVKAEEKPIDWGMGEYLAYATLLWEGTSVRLTGQDVCRGTFSHRHAIWIDQEDGKAYYPLQHLKPNQGQFEIYNSTLSEFAALGFEYGYSIGDAKTLVIWEAQFGDFVNGAQVVIDQYISSAEQKWGQTSGLTLLLPHAYEGQGPEHSSGRMERFLSLCGRNNMIVANPTLPAQLFHLLRRQMIKPFLKPLIIFTPKGLLRNPACVSSLKEFTQGSFSEILDDPSPPKNVKQLVFCQGHIFYELISHREKLQTHNMAILRFEQLYPFNKLLLKSYLEKYKGFEECFWVQEEPKNMGAWSFIQPYLRECLPSSLEAKYIGREPSASPATGSHAIHKKEQSVIINQLFGESNENRR